MNKVFTLILIIGISIGLLLGSSINILANKNHNQSEGKKENEFSQTINKESQNQDDNNQISNEQPLEKTDTEEYVNIIIQNGFTSNKVADILFENQLIFNKNDFLTLLKCLDLSSNLRVGEKKIKKGSSMMEIIDIITN
ncbi:hypothetical protein [Tepidibacter hydrothermalis]|uniref:Uncharacterized protein n=1 Tax=Tepidibacter hydrothermalis TaxID=3036126 RepID=A0ABY8EL38_9FIRM|nr:hypothetical protein [Tepidibacter hydrothermalis]WFD12060.1 hypothetical protein P4S50_08270 [Tepidibacter hydrothermalis]